MIMEPIDIRYISMVREREEQTDSYVDVDGVTYRRWPGVMDGEPTGHTTVEDDK